MTHSLAESKKFLLLSGSLRPSSCINFQLNVSRDFLKVRRNGVLPTLPKSSAGRSMGGPLSPGYISPWETLRGGATINECGVLRAPTAVTSSLQKGSPPPASHSALDPDPEAAPAWPNHRLPGMPPLTPSWSPAPIPKALFMMLFAKAHYAFLYTFPFIWMMINETISKDWL